MDEKDGIRTRPGEADGQGLSPLRAFIVVCTLATVVGGGFFATRDAAPSEPPPPTAPRSPDYSLTDEEALAEFERLRSGAVAAIRNRDLSMIDEVFTSEGPLQERASGEIRALLRKKVVDRSVFTTIRTAVVRNTSTEFAVVEESRLDPCFLSSSGRDVTAGPAAVRQVAEWTVRLQDARWLLHDAKILRDKELVQREAACE